MQRSRFGFKSWLGIAAGLILACGTSLGYLVGVHFGPAVTRAEAFPEQSEPAPVQAERIVRVTNERVYQALKLSQEQCAEADRILSDAFQQYMGLREEREAISRKMESNISALLNEEQREIWNRIKRWINLDGVEERVSQRVAYYKSELRLSAEQEDRFYNVYLDDHFRKDDLFRQLRERSDRGDKVPHEERQASYEKLNAERAEKLKPILSSEQWARFKELDEKKRDWFQKSSRGRRGGGGPLPPPDKVPPEPR